MNNGMIEHFFKKSPATIYCVSPETPPVNLIYYTPASGDAPPGKGDIYFYQLSLSAFKKCVGFILYKGLKFAEKATNLSGK